VRRFLSNYFDLLLVLL